MHRIISDTLRFFNYKIPPISDTIRGAADAYIETYISSLRINQSAHDVLRILIAKYKLGLVTNFAYSLGVYRILDQFASRPCFKAIIISGEVGWKKPSPRIFEMALSQMSVKPKEVIFVGDDYEADIMGAKNVGMTTVFLNKGFVNGEKADTRFELWRHIFIFDETLCFFLLSIKGGF